jgi:predicted phage terminase large subunit-like protein
VSDVAVTPVARWEPTERQRAFLASGAYEALYGGAAGGGKTQALVIGALRHIDKPSYNAIIFRRTFPELEGEVIPVSREWYPLCGGKYNAVQHCWTFPSGARIHFGHLQHEHDVERYQGWQFQYCAATDTQVVMGDGTLRFIQSVAVGDVVATLQGPRRVTGARSAGRKSCYKVSANGAAIVVSGGHRLLTPNGWASPEELISTECRADGSTPEASELQSLALDRPLACRPLDLQPSVGPLPRNHQETIHLETSACEASSQSDSATSDDGPRESPQPQRWIVRLVLHVPSSVSAELSTEQSTLRDAQARDHADSLALDSLAGCHFDDGCGGGQSPSPSISDRACTPSPVDAAAHCQPDSLPDGQTSTQARSPTGSYTYCHPYTNNPMVASEAVRLAPASMVQAGEREVFDLTIEGASHYVTSGGFISRNCGFDELTHFTEHQYTYIANSRVRSAQGIPARVRAGTNPGGVGHEWVMKRWGPWLDPECAVHAEPGKTLHYRNTDDGPEWGERGTGTLSRVFVPALLEDNPHLVENDPSYADRLRGLDRVTRARLLSGNWLVKPAAGAYYQRSWFSILDTRPLGSVLRVRRWDLASTENGGDWTVGVRMALMPDRSLVVEDVVRVRQRPGGVEETVLNTAKMDTREVHVSLAQDPGQAGKAQVEGFVRKLSGWVVRAKPETGDKVTRQSPFSAQCEAKNVSIVQGAWNEPFLQCLEAFGDKGVHDDDVDAAAGAFTYLAERLPNISYMNAVEKMAKEAGLR